jgi:tRNA 2-thiouridine synthesizing protein A
VPFLCDSICARRKIPLTKRSENEPRLIDARGLKCPWPVLRAARAMREADAVTLLADDPVAMTDVPALAAHHGWAISMTDEGNHSRYELSETRR